MDSTACKKFRLIQWYFISVNQLVENSDQMSSDVRSLSVTDRTPFALYSMFCKPTLNEVGMHVCTDLHNIPLPFVLCLGCTYQRSFVTSTHYIVYIKSVYKSLYS